jgi:hypothetical protein
MIIITNPLKNTFMKFVTHNNKKINSAGTSGQGSIFVKFTTLVNKLGQPDLGSGDNKVAASWDIEFESGDIVTIYNWKDGKNYLGIEGLDIEDITDWHVGGFNKSALNLVREIISE